MIDISKEKKMKVLIFHPALAPYRIGIFNSLFSISDLTLYLLTKNNANQYFDQKKLVAELTDSPNYLSDVYTFFGRNVPLGINGKLKQYSPDIVITTEFSSASIIVAIINVFRKRKYAHIVWTDDNKELILGDALHRKISRKIFSHLADGWFFISKETQEYYKKVVGIKTPSALIPVVHNDMEFRKILAKTDKIRDTYIKKYELADKYVLLFVGRLVKVKALDQLIRTFQKVSIQLDSAALIIVGEGEETVYLKKLAYELGIAEKVKFVGRFEGEELLAWYRVGKVFTLASFYEPFGAVVNEALISGMPAVVSQKVGAKSLIKPRVNGDVVDTTNMDEFSEILLYWLKKMGPLKGDEVIPNSLMSFDFSDVACGVDELFIKLQHNSEFL